MGGVAAMNQWRAMQMNMNKMNGMCMMMCRVSECIKIR